MPQLKEMYDCKQFTQCMFSISKSSLFLLSCPEGFTVVQGVLAVSQLTSTRGSP